jgi:hypothetical protein
VNGSRTRKNEANAGKVPDDVAFLVARPLWRDLPTYRSQGRSLGFPAFSSDPVSPDL